MWQGKWHYGNLFNYLEENIRSLPFTYKYISNEFKIYCKNNTITVLK